MSNDGRLMDEVYVLDFWGKAGPQDAASVAYHPIAFHSLDVAAAVRQILLARPLALERGAALLALDPDQALELVVSLTALHDIGKFGKAFQSKRPDLWPAALGPFRPAANSLHTYDGYLLWNDGLSRTVAERLWPGEEGVLNALAPAIFGHHGRPVTRTTAIASHVLSEAGAHAARTCVAAMLDVLDSAVVSDSSGANRERAQIASWWLAGLITLADWIGSNEKWFAYHRVDHHASLVENLASYWGIAQQRAISAVCAAGLLPATPAAPRSFMQLTGRPTPTPAQSWASHASLPDGPVLIILEEATGAGKTEAAQMLVHRLMSDGRATGAYWAMPTQATANAMYERQGKAIAQLFADDGDRLPSLVLAHGQARLHEKFRASVLGMAASPTTTRYPDPAITDTPSSVACAAFLADDRRKSLLADIGAGTIDQALLGVLPSRFNALRLFGLSDKVLVVDEAHAYDAYVSTELEALLKFHAALGGCAIVLSATLANHQRTKLIEAWRAGLPIERIQAPMFAPPQLDRTISEHYPLATVVGAGGDTVETPLASHPTSRPPVSVRFVHDEAAVVDEIMRAVGDRAAVAWVRNTVGDCLRGAEALRSRGIEPIVFHSRFAQFDRQARETEVLRLFGEKVNEERCGRVVVATQVIEQSLDLDFDALFSDVAPVDLLIQRAGRLWRHLQLRPERPAASRCELVVLAPPFEKAPPRDWLKAFLPGTNAVYSNTGVIWRTVKTLTESGRIVTPGTGDRVGGLRALVRAVYGSDDVPPNLEDATNRAMGSASAATSTARYGTLNVADGYHGAATGWVDDIRVPTRLGREETVVRLARVSPDGTLEPWANTDSGDEFPAWKRWALSEVRVSAHHIPRGAAAEKPFDSAIALVRAEWGRYEQEIPVVPLAASGPGLWTGTMHKDDRDGRVEIRYSATDGMVVVQGTEVKFGAGQPVLRV